MTDLEKSYIIMQSSMTYVSDVLKLWTDVLEIQQAYLRFFNDYVKFLGLVPN